MIYASTCLICIFAIELFFFFPILRPVKRLVEVSQKTVRVISSHRISDHWKEKALQRYSRDMAVSSLAMAFGLLSVLVLVSIAAWLLDLVTASDTPTLEYLVSLQGLSLATVFSLLYLYARKRIVQS